MVKRLLEEAKRIIRTRSVSVDGSEELANHFANLMKDRGLSVNLQQVMHSLEDVSKRQFNVIGVLGDPLVDRKIRKGLLLISHLDTVGPGIKEQWTETDGNPYNGTIKENRIYGLGAADCKLDLLCKLQAVQKFREKKLKMPVYLVGTCGEEAGMFGARYLIQSKVLNPRYVLVGMPTNLNLVTNHKSLHVYEVTVTYHLIDRDARGFNRRINLFSYGRSAHSAYPAEGHNAIIRLVDFLKKAIDGGFEMQFTRLEGGTPVNQVPDSAMAEFYLTSHHFEDFKRFFRELGKATDDGNSFKIELGGLGDMGICFLPENLFPCFLDVLGFFTGLESELAVRKDERYSPSTASLSFGRIRQLPGRADLLFDLRLMPDESPEDVERRVQEGIRRIAAAYPALNISVEKRRAHPPLRMAEGHEWTRLCEDVMKEVGIDPTFEPLSLSTEAGLFQEAGYDAVVFGAGSSKQNIHAPNEYNLLDQMQQSITFYEKMIERVCL